MSPRGQDEWELKADFNRRHGAVPLTPLRPGDPVLVKTNEKSVHVWKKAESVFAADPENCTELVNSPAEVLRRNRKNLQKLPLPRRVVTGGPGLSVASRQHLIHMMSMIRRTSIQRMSRIRRVRLLLLHLLQWHANTRAARGYRSDYSK